MNDNLRDLIEASAPLWAGEAEVVRTYFNAPSRNAETDRAWLRRQCFKEFYGSGYGEPEHGMLVEWGREIIALPSRALLVTRSTNLAGPHAEEAIILAEVPIRGQHAVYAKAEDGADGNGDGQAHDVDTGHHFVAHQVPQCDYDVTV